MSAFRLRNCVRLSRTSPKAFLLASAFGAALGGVSGPALAQGPANAAADEAADANNAPVITVTARKQAETLQEVPVAVTVLGGETLRSFQVNEVADVVSRVPALNVQVGGSGAGGQITLRGVGSTNICNNTSNAGSWKGAHCAVQMPP